MGKKIAVTFEKGGVGKTTTAVNVSAILAERGYKVLLVDLDFQSYSTGYLGLYDDDRQSIFDVLAKSVEIEKVIISAGIENFDIVPAVRELKTIDTYLAAIPFGQEYILKNALKPVDDNYDFIIFDCPPAGLRIKTNAMAAADGLILPTVPDDYGIQGLICISEDIVAIKRGTNPDLKVYGVLITIDEKNNNKNAYREALQSQNIFNCFKQTIRKNTTLSEAINSHKPIIHYDKNCNGAKDYIAFTDELLEVIANG